MITLHARWAKCRLPAHLTLPMKIFATHLYNPPPLSPRLQPQRARARAEAREGPGVRTEQGGGIERWAHQVTALLLMKLHKQPVR